MKTSQYQSLSASDSMVNAQIPVAEFFGEIGKLQLAAEQKSVLFMTTLRI
jgi:hypothetical protein